MAVIRYYQHGMTAGVPPRVNDHKRVPRGEVGGWSDAATRRNVRFLYSILEKELDGQGFAFTLTLRDCPATAGDWHALRRAWLMRMQRRGMIRLHWVTEWQRRGVPHLHGVAYFPPGARDRTGMPPMGFIALEWCEVARAYGAEYWAQQCKPVTDAVGWFQYLSKHAARGVSHYQRCAANIPEGWQSLTGRVWGHTGEWPRREAVRINVAGREGDGGWFAFRRLVRSWRVADARAEPIAKNRPRRILTARRMLACNEQKLSEVRGVSEWCPVAVQDGFLANLAARGYAITC